MIKSAITVFFSSRRRHTIWTSDWSSDVCSSDLHIARSVQEALAQAELRRFDLLLCDIGLPDGDGSAILNEIRKHYPIEGIVLSAHAFPADIRSEERRVGKERRGVCPWDVVNKRY